MKMDKIVHFIVYTLIFRRHCMQFRNSLYCQVIRIGFCLGIRMFLKEFEHRYKKYE